MRTIELKCPDCSAKGSVEIWSSINVGLDPEAKEQLLEGKINIFRCDRCGHQSAIAAPMLYHDLTKKFLVQYIPFRMTKDRDYLDSLDNDGRPMRPLNLPKAHVPSYFGSIHIVFSMDELARYVVFRDRLVQCKARRGDKGQACLPNRP